MGLIDLAFLALSAVAIVSGWRVFATDSMVRASFLLLLSFTAVGLIILMLAAPYIGIATIFMMAVEMMVMALFMVMFMMNPAGLNPMMMVHQNRFAIGAGVVAFVGLSAAILATDFPTDPVDPGRQVIRDLGLEMLGPSMLIFETAGVTLLAAMVGAVVLSARTGRFGRSDEGSRPPGLEVGGEPAGRRVEKASGHGHHHMHGSHDGHEDAEHAEGHPEADGHDADGGESGRRPSLRSDWSAGDRSMTSKTKAPS
ncbi:NADH-quinone oxidoreductase subunit J [Aurantimonas sp. E1-2-R+4]|uniref:NADH-quinone oxidoreductase subunit J family protein n=1 Tax=Aurantimonas sp. E1-2-R+4 TaxID=3113714 RepID=UPI002F95CCCF